MLVGTTPFNDSTIDELYKSIEKGDLKFPSYISKNAKNLIIVNIKSF